MTRVPLSDVHPAELALLWHAVHDGGRMVEGGWERRHLNIVTSEPVRAAIALLWLSETFEEAVRKAESGCQYDTSELLRRTANADRPDPLLRLCRDCGQPVPLEDVPAAWLRWPDWHDEPA